MRVLTFSKVFPKKHPREGDETDFAKKILNGSKKHTIRAGHRWKAGDFFNARQWSDRPYKSKQVSISDGIPVYKIWSFIIKDGNYFLDGRKLTFQELITVANNDGLEVDDFECWFPDSFNGQIICWDETIYY